MTTITTIINIIIGMTNESSELSSEWNSIKAFKRSDSSKVFVWIEWIWKLLVANQGL
jgi:hypothetical protein